MAQEKISYEQFIEATGPEARPLIRELHDNLTKIGCKAAFELKKSGPLASYKYGKPPKALLNVVFRKEGQLARVYGENTSTYSDFLNTLPKNMVQEIDKSGDCGRLVNNTCSPKCTGYDFEINGQHFQKCRYGCFMFLITPESGPYIKSLVEHELGARIN